MKTRMIALFLCAAVAVVGTSCEGGGGHEDEVVVEELDHNTTNSSSLSGTWSGRAGTSQTSTKLRLSQSGNSLSGSWTWGAGDTRSCKGSVSGSSVTLKDTRSDGDTWHLHLSADGSRLSGTGSKYGGGSYSVSFSR